MILFIYKILFFLIILATNVDLPTHPEIFCPVFSAPHYTGNKI